MRRMRREENGDASDAIRKAMKLLLHKNRSEYELRSRLKEGGFADQAVEEAIDYVSSFGYLNDRRYAEAYAASYADKKSRAAIRAGLQEKRVDEQLISEVLSELPSDETVLMRRLLQARAGEPHRLEDAEFRRLAGYLGRRGFGTSDIMKVLRAYQEAAEEV